MAKILIVGEAWGEEEEKQGKPFVGPAGIELRRQLQEAGIDYNECEVTNVFNFRPENSKIDSICGKKAEVGGKDYTRPQLATGKYIKPEFFPHLEILKETVERVKPNVIIALGNTACWALLDNAGITKLRGTVAECTLVPGVKVIPTFHPAAILRNWSNRAIAILDLAKAKRESFYPQIIRKQRKVLIPETVADLDWLKAEYNNLAKHEPIKVATDIETAPKQRIITCVGFATSDRWSFVIPFYDKTKPEGAFWEFPHEEILAWQFVREILKGPQPKIFQNGVYDIQYLWKVAGCPVLNANHDTMIMHHAMQPELPKSLAFLGSIYADEIAWKLLRRRGQNTNKGDE